MKSVQRSEAFMNTFFERCIQSKKLSSAGEFLDKKALVMGFDLPKRKRKKHKAKGFTAKKRRELKLFKLNPDLQRYDTSLPLHELWKQYIRDLCQGLRPDAQPQMIQNKMLKADLHGALVTGPHTHYSKAVQSGYVGLSSDRLGLLTLAVQF
ncbi:hypothetical protein GDO78_003357 [Eleutherodactylus coqui]|uniref:Uncharacterized protein n=1 Tax=Eleutherodactylus coqui TaxID=57060 RepID=A0A8J6K0Z9_ELECQ|nr:hypothetical protein GDO78_003357 [Eleutherodactylus coqui]